MLGLFLFLYITCEVGVWNWLPRHLIAQGIPESRALNILSLGFALGLLIGRVGVSPILIHVPAIEVTLAASIAMAVTTFLMLRTNKPTAAFALVFIAGVSMAPVFPTTLAIAGTAFPRMTGTALGFVITCYIRQEQGNECGSAHPQMRPGRRIVIPSVRWNARAVNRFGGSGFGD